MFPAKRVFPLVFAVCSVIVFISSCGSGGSTQLRVLNAIPDETAGVNVLLGSKTLSSSLSYGNNTGYDSVGSGSQTLVIEPTSSTTALINESVSLGSGTETTVIAANYSASPQAIVLLDDNTTPSSGDASLRIVNAAPGMAAAQPNIYIVTTGTGITGTTPLITSLAFGTASSYQTLVAGTYDVYFTYPGADNTVSTYPGAGPVTITLTSGQNRTMVSLNTLSGSFSTVTLADLN